MRLNIECIRDVLLTSEEKTNLNNEVINIDVLVTMPRLKNYNEEDIIYTIKKLKEANYIEADILIHSDGNRAMIRHLTYEGHLFLDNIRDDGIWKKAKKEASKISSSVSINILSNIAIKLSSLYWFLLFSEKSNLR